MQGGTIYSYSAVKTSNLRQIKTFVITPVTAHSSNNGAGYCDILPVLPTPAGGPERTTTGRANERTKKDKPAMVITNCFKTTL